MLMKENNLIKRKQIISLIIISISSLFFLPINYLSSLSRFENACTQKYYEKEKDFQHCIYSKTNNDEDTSKIHNLFMKTRPSYYEKENNVQYVINNNVNYLSYACFDGVENQPISFVGCPSRAINQMDGKYYIDKSSLRVKEKAESSVSNYCYVSPSLAQKLLLFFELEDADALIGCNINYVLNVHYSSEPTTLRITNLIVDDDVSKSLEDAVGDFLVAFYDDANTKRYGFSLLYSLNKSSYKIKTTLETIYKTVDCEKTDFLFLDKGAWNDDPILPTIKLVEFKPGSAVLTISLIVFSCLLSFIGLFLLGKYQASLKSNILFRIFTPLVLFLIPYSLIRLVFLIFKLPVSSIAGLSFGITLLFLLILNIVLVFAKRRQLP